jgi:hypothetical protein
MKKARMLVLVVLMAIVSTSAFAGWSSDAIKYSNQGRSNDAMNVLKANLTEASMNDAIKFQKAEKNELAKMIYRNLSSNHVEQKVAARASFNLGMILIESGETVSANYFSRAIAKAPGKYDSVIRKELTNAAVKEFNKGNFRNSKFFTIEAKKHGTSIPSINNQFFVRAKTWFQNGDIKTAKEATDIIIRNGYNKQTAYKAIMEIGHSLNGEVMVDVYRYAYKLYLVKNDDSRKAGLRIAEYARSIEDPKVFSLEIGDLLNLATLMTDKNFKINQYIVAYEEGKHKFLNLQNGSITNHWISIKENRTHYWKVFLMGGKHQILFSTGEITRLWTNDRFSSAKYFKFQTIEKGSFKLKIYKNETLAKL